MRGSVVAFLAIAVAGCAYAADAQSGTVSVDGACGELISRMDGLSGDAGWSIVTPTDLLPSDAELWTTYHPNLCPGMAEVDLDGDGTPEFAVTEIRRSESGVAQRLSLYRSDASRPERLWQAESVPFPYVVFASQAQEARDFYSGVATPIEHGSFIIERMEAWAVLYFEADGRFEHVLISD